jgi:uncharacterized protein (TIGR01777 family)
MASRLSTTRAVNDLIARLETKPAALINASAVGFYGDRGEQLLTESAPRGPGFAGDLVSAWEREAQRASMHGLRVALIRFGVVLGRDGGAWPAMTMSLPFGLGAMFGDGSQFMPWIHKHDALRVLHAAIDDARLNGPINAVAPQETRHGALIRAAADAVGCKILLPVPAFLLRTGLGEMSALFLDSARVIPRALGAVGFVFEFATIEAAACDLLRRQPAKEHALGRASRSG